MTNLEKVIRENKELEKSIPKQPVYWNSPHGSLTDEWRCPNCNAYLFTKDPDYNSHIGLLAMWNNRMPYCDGCGQIISAWVGSYEHFYIDDKPPHTRDFSRELGGSY